MKTLKAVLTLLNIAATIVFLWLKGRFSGMDIVIAVGLFLLASAIHLVAHEGGHFIGGAVSGYKLLRLQLGPLNIVKNVHNQFQIFWKSALSGQCIMIPKQSHTVRFKAYNLGGVFANILFTLLSFGLLFLDSFYMTLFFVELLCVGVHKALINAIPHKTNSMPNDGYVVKLLKKDEAIQKDYAMYLMLYEKLFWNEPIDPQDYTYKRKAPADADDLLYYNEIQGILSEVDT